MDGARKGARRGEQAAWMGASNAGHMEWGGARPGGARKAVGCGLGAGVCHRGRSTCRNTLKGAATHREGARCIHGGRGVCMGPRRKLCMVNQ